jgi:micrococcal nuclease
MEAKHPRYSARTVGLWEGVVTRIIAAALVTVALGLLAANAWPSTVRVIDGDTIAIEAVVYRLEGVDAPELLQAEGRAARAALVELIGPERPRCRGTGARSYERRVAVCYVRGIDLGAAMVVSGWAFVDPDWRYTKRYLALQSDARGRGVGAWAGKPVMPWVWRRSR